MPGTLLVMGLLETMGSCGTMKRVSLEVDYHPVRV
jgi:hypothetical protein